MANVYSEPVDAAFRYGKPQDSSLVALPLAADHRRVLCAAPAYLAAHGMPDTPHALAEHQGLCFMLGEDVHDRWRFFRDGEAQTVQVSGNRVADDGDTVRRWAVAGRGIARLRSAGIHVEVLPPGSQAACASRELNIGFVSRMARGRPWLRLKAATSLRSPVAYGHLMSSDLMDMEFQTD